jgi:two-component system, OmpR family, sensor kinase
VTRLPIRIRLTLAFAIAMAVVLAAIGVFLYVRLASSLDETIDDGLEARAADAAAVVARGDGGPSRSDDDDSFVRVVDGDGPPFLDARERARLDEGSFMIERARVAGVDGRARLLVVPVDSPSGRQVVVAGASLEERDETLRGFLGELLLVGPAALALASLLGYAIAAAALRPVEAMRAEAHAVSAADPGRRLPLPESRDEISRLGETLNAMLDRLESALEQERTFVANASHELRTPLALLKTELELALRRPRSPAELEAALGSALVETDRLARLAEDLLVLARSDRGGLALRTEPVAARSLAERVAGRFAQTAAEAGRPLEVDVPPDLVVRGDAPRLEQALGNLVDNALRHGRGPVRLTATEHAGVVELHVADGGRGFPAEFLPRAFERFTRADEARTGGGAGLGLAIAEAIARAHGGSAHAGRGANGGADVWLSLPRFAA